MANEKRLIDLGESLRMIKNSRADCPETSIKGRAIWETAHNCALSCLTSCPTVDAAPVVHGRWIRRHNETKCSRCKFIYYSNHDDFNYCPNCGAKMDGGNEDG